MEYQSISGDVKDLYEVLTAMSGADPIPEGSELSVVVDQNGVQSVTNVLNDNLGFKRLPQLEADFAALNIKMNSFTNIASAFVEYIGYLKESFDIMNIEGKKLLVAMSAILRIVLESRSLHVSRIEDVPVLVKLVVYAKWRGKIRVANEDLLTSVVDALRKEGEDLKVLPPTTDPVTVTPRPWISLPAVNFELLPGMIPSANASWSTFPHISSAPTSQDGSSQATFSASICDLRLSFPPLPLEIAILLSGQTILPSRNRFLSTHTVATTSTVISGTNHSVPNYQSDLTMSDDQSD